MLNAKCVVLFHYIDLHQQHYVCVHVRAYSLSVWVIFRETYLCTTDHAHLFAEFYLIIHCHTDLPSFAVEVMATPSASTDVLG